MEKVRLGITRTTVFALENPEQMKALKDVILPSELLQCRMELLKLKQYIDNILKDLE